MRWTVSPLTCALALATALIFAAPASEARPLRVKAPRPQQQVEYPPGTCLDALACQQGCSNHADVHEQGGAPTGLVGQCETACNTQSLPGHPGEFMAKCVERGADDLECVESLVELNLCLFQAAADPTDSAQCLAAVSPKCLK